MHETLDIFRMAQGLALHASARQGLVARNVANADTPGYRARDLEPFAQTYRDAEPALAATRRGHMTAADPGPQTARSVDSPGASSPNGNTVSLEAEMIRGAEVKRAHDMALAVYKSSLGILRMSLGRGG